MLPLNDLIRGVIVLAILFTLYKGVTSPFARKPWFIALGLCILCYAGFAYYLQKNPAGIQVNAWGGFLDLLF